MKACLTPLHNEELANLITLSLASNLHRLFIEEEDLYILMVSLMYHQLNLLRYTKVKRVGSANQIYEPHLFFRIFHSKAHLQDLNPSMIWKFIKKASILSFINLLNLINIKRIIKLMKQSHPFFHSQKCIERALG